MSAAPAVPRKEKARRPADYFRVTTEDIFELRGKVSGDSQLFIIHFIVCETFGKARKPGAPPPLYACFTHRQLAGKGGCSVRQAVDLVADAEQRVLIEAIEPKEAQRLGLGPARHPQAKWYRALPDNWATAPKYAPPKPKLVVMERLDDEPGGDDDGEETPQPESAAVVQVSPDQPLVLMPGAKSRPVPWVSKATKYSFDCSGVSVPLSIERECCFGVVKFKISNSNQHVTANSQNAKGRRTGEPPMKPSSQVNTGVSEEREVGAAIRKHGIHTDDVGIKLLIRKCRENARDARVDEMVHFVDVKAPGVRRRGDNPFGLLVKAVSDCFKGESFRAFRSERQSKPALPKCWKCGAELAGSSFDGACLECFEAHHATRGGR